jgi:hypothetical protein
VNQSSRPLKHGSSDENMSMEEEEEKNHSVKKTMDYRSRGMSYARGAS